MLFDLFKKQNKKSLTKTGKKKEWYEIELERMIKEEKAVDKELGEFGAIRDDYEDGKDVQECISRAETLLSSDVKWNKAKVWLFLVGIYKKIDNNKAWETLQRFHKYIMESDYPIENKLACEMDIYYEEFKISRQEKRYKDALCYLAQYYVLRSGMERGGDFYIDRFLKEARTTAKGLGLNDEQLNDLATRISRIRKSKNVANDARKVYLDWIKNIFD